MIAKTDHKLSTCSKDSKPSSVSNVQMSADMKGSSAEVGQSVNTGEVEAAAEGHVESEDNKGARKVEAVYHPVSELPRTKDVLLDHMQAVIYGLMPEALHLVMPSMHCCSIHELFQLLGDRDRLLKQINHILHHKISSSTEGRLVSSTSANGIHSVSESLGDKLFAKVVEIETELSAQITGMILESNEDVVEQLLMDPESLERAVLMARAEYMQQCHPDLLPARPDLADRLYHVIHQNYPQLAAKVTGMLLEMDIGTLQYLLTNPTDLKKCVDQAVETLQKLDS